MPGTQQQFDRLSVADFNRRLESMAERVGELASQVAVIGDREKNIATEIEKLEKSIVVLAETISRGRGAIYMLISMGGVVTFIATFWDKLTKPWH